MKQPQVRVSKAAPWLNPSQPPGLGVDIRRVISADDDVGGISILTERWAETSFVPDCLTVLSDLQQIGPFKDRIFLVSKCGPIVEQRTRLWLYSNDFFRQTGVPEHHVSYVREHSAKAGVFEECRISHFIDDRPRNLSFMQAVPRRYLLAAEQPPQEPPWALHVRSWSEFRLLLMKWAENQTSAMKDARHLDSELRADLFS